MTNTGSLFDPLIGTETSIRTAILITMHAYEVGLVDDEFGYAVRYMKKPLISIELHQITKREVDIATLIRSLSMSGNLP